MHFPERHVAELNEAQRQAAEALAGPVMVLAGPGTGKTRTLVARLVHLVERLGVEPSRIIAVTYTNKATEQMRERVRSALGDAAGEIAIGTFHAFCIEALRTHSDLLGLSAHFTVADETCQLEMLRRAVPAIQSAGPRGVLLGKLSRATLDPDRGGQSLSPFERDAQERYRRLLRENCLIDFDDILVLMWQLLGSHPDAAAELRGNFDAIVIDEFQDTDPLQYRIFRFLAEHHRNIFAVADDDQSIFSWRGAHPENIDAFIADFPGALVVRLDRTFRSTQHIVECAGRLIRQTFGCRAARGAKSIETHREEGEPPQLRSFATDYEEALFIAEEIARRRAERPGLRYADFAVLYARHSIGNRLQQILVERGIPAQLVRSKGLFDSPQVRRLLLAVQVLVNPQDEFALERLAETELTELEFTSIRQRTNAGGKPRSFRAALRNALAGRKAISPEASRLRRLLQEIQNLRATIKRRRASRISDVVDELLSASGLLAEDEDAAGIGGSIDPLSDASFAAAAREVSSVLQRGSPPIVVCENEVIRSLAQSIANRAAHLCIKPGRRAGRKKSVRAPAVIFAVATGLTDEVFGTASAGDLIVSLFHGGSMGAETCALPSGGMARVLCIPRSPFHGQESPLAKSSVDLFFRLMQAAVAVRLEDDLGDYVAIDIETTEADPGVAEIVELAAVKVRNGKAVEEALFQFKPRRKISAAAGAVHGISEESLSDCPSFSAGYPAALEFLGGDLLVAHNGFEFDFPILSRQMKETCGMALANPLFDSLSLARRLFPHQGASIDALAQRFGLQTGERHRALDDTRVLVRIFELLKQHELARRRARLLCDCAGKLVLAFTEELGENFVPLESSYKSYKKGLTLLLKASSVLDDQLLAEFPGPFFSERVERLKALFSARDFAGEGAAAEREAFEFRSQVDAIVARFDRLPLEEALAAFLDYVSLFQTQDGLADRDAVNLLTIYAAKGLEFSQVFVAGLEENVLPSVYAIRSGDTAKVEEQRRLLYVALTRAKDGLILSWAGERDGFAQQPSSFLSELFPREESARQ